MCIVRDHLEMPLQLARVGIERDRRIRVQIVTLANVSIPVRRRIPSSPDNQVLGGIEGAGHPSWRAAVLPRVAGPAFVALFARSGHCPKAPAPLAGLGIVRVQEA